MQFRLSLSAVDRGLDLNTKLVLARRADETMEHVVLRLLAYCLYEREADGGGLAFALGPADRDGPDLWAHDLAGRPVEWIVCGQADGAELRHVLQHRRDTQVRVLLGGETEREELFHEL